MITVDFSNAFNLVDRTALLSEVQTRCPFTFLWVDFLYGQPARLNIGDDHISSTTRVSRRPLGASSLCLSFASPHSLDTRYMQVTLDDGTIIGDAKEVAKALEIIKV
ncbi:hypothetical protein HanRHA438_Chr12g0567251 [Helianthus annuus]|nr:hypothetical protein HanIR_Chr12g0599951 [Helianthus annuus]KAJ0867793.1 hypothetical protein HanRHA438_Chr12g0567251 [Helianthus annuus]